MAAPAKVSKELEGDSAEMLAWGLLEWIRQVEDVRDRAGILGAFTVGLSAGRGASVPLVEGAAHFATGEHRRIAYRLTRLVAEMEGRDIGQRNQGDRQWILETFAECLDAVMGRWVAGVAPSGEAGPVSA